MKFFIPALAGIFLFVGTPAMANPADVYGLWLTESKTGHVDIQDCGDGTPCGTLVWIDAPDPDAELDEFNPDPALRSRTMVGIKLVWGFKPSAKGWKKGNIYDPQDGKTYRSHMMLTDSGDLQVKGCIGPLCKAQIWTKVETD